MRGFRLNGWHRIGIVLSVLWTAGVLFLERDYWKQSGSRQERMFYQCSFAPNNADQSLCNAKMTTYYDARTRVLQESLLYRLGLVPIVWLLAYVVVWTVRWIRRGFQPSI